MEANMNPIIAAVLSELYPNGVPVAQLAEADRIAQAVEHAITPALRGWDGTNFTHPSKRPTDDGELNAARRGGVIASEGVHEAREAFYARANGKADPFLAALRSGTTVADLMKLTGSSKQAVRARIVRLEGKGAKIEKVAIKSTGPGRPSSSLKMVREPKAAR